MSSDIERLLSASIQLIEKDAVIEQLRAELHEAHRQLAKAHLWADMRAQAAEFELSADAPVDSPIRRQAE